MASPHPTRSARAAVVLAALLALLPSCSRRPERAPGTTLDEAALARMARQTEERLRSFGQEKTHRFEVIEFHPTSPMRVDFLDDFKFRTGMCFFGFTARLRYLADVAVADKAELERRQGAPDYVSDDTYDGLETLALLGPGVFPVGAEARVEAAAAFDDLDPGWRFHRFDEKRAR
jgi:hypothetical protein